MRKQIFGTVFVLCLLLSAVLLAVSASAAATKISTADELLDIMNDSTKWGTSYTLTADIDLSKATNGKSQTPIGRSSASGDYYHATFDGDGHSITGLDIDGGTTGYAGLFGYISSTTVIKNLKVYGTVTSTGGYAGGLVGVARAACTIQNVECHVDVTGAAATGGVIGAIVPASSRTLKLSGVQNYGNVNGTHYVGGIIGWQNGGGGTVAISDTTNYGKITATDSSGGCAGILGWIKPGASTTNTFTNVQNEGAIGGTTAVGGIIGNISGDGSSATITISGATNTGTVTGSSTSVAGIVARAIAASGFTLSIDNATNTAAGTIRGASSGYVGGIMGIFTTHNSTAPDAAISITNSVNEGSVTSNAAFAGGILGYFYYSVATANYSADTVRRSTIDTCENRGAVHAVTKYAGGIIGCFGNNGGGSNVPLTCSKVSNRGSITADESFAAGITGLARSTITSATVEKVIYTDCVNYGTITAPYGAAGIIGATTSGKYPYYLTNCYNAGTLPASSTNATYPVHPILSSDVSAVASNNYYSGSEDAAETKGSFISDPTAESSFDGFDFTDIWAMGEKGPEIRAFHTHNAKGEPVILSSTQHRVDCTCGEAGTAEDHTFEGTVCAVCGFDSACKHTSTHEEITAATCVSTGLHSLICDDCAETVSSEVIAIDPNNHVDTAFVWDYNSQTGKYYLTCSACSAAYGHTTEAPTVYVNGESGDNAMNGMTASTAVKTISAAIPHIANCGGTVVITSYTLSANEPLPSWNGLVTFTAGEFDANGEATTGITIAKTAATLTMGGDAKFDGLLFKGTSSSVCRIYLAADWHNLDIGYVRVQTYARAYVFAGPAYESGTNTEAKSVTLNLDMPAMSTNAGDYFYERIYCGSAIHSASADIENKNVTLTVNKGYANAKASTRTQSGTVYCIYAMSTTATEGYNPAVVDGCTANIQIGGDVVVGTFRTGDANTTLYPAAVSLDTLSVTLNDNAVINDFWAKNVKNATVTLSTSAAGRTTKQAAQIRFAKVGDFASESAALTLNYGTHSFASTLASNYAASGYTVTENVTDECTWDTTNTDNDITNSAVGLYTCTCGRTKASDSFVYDKGAFAGPVTNESGDTLHYMLRMIVRGYVPTGKTVAYYGIAMLPLTDADWTTDDNNDYIAKNVGDLESGTTFSADLVNIPTSEITTNIFAWAFVKYTDSDDVVTIPLGTYVVNDYLVEG